MFYHAFDAYIKHAFPADELRPLDCSGRYRDSIEDRGDIDEAMGNYSLTLVDSLDTLAVFDDLDAFEHAVMMAVKRVTFDHDVVVSVFEANIRMLGGLLSAHVLADRIRLGRPPRFVWYSGQLLRMAADLGRRLLPAFETKTGLPRTKINLKYGTDRIGGLTSQTCSACAGSLLLEFATLSRLTGEPIFEAKARKAMDVLWRLRNNSSDLIGHIVSTESGKWIDAKSGVGAGIDSYFEYVAKAYVLFGDAEYLHRWMAHYSTLMQYSAAQSPVMWNVHMDNPNVVVNTYADALTAFWPGLQVLMGDVSHAVQMHEMLRLVADKYDGFLPESFNVANLNVHWPFHLLRPELIESTYLLYQATGDHDYLHFGKRLMLALNSTARVPCGFATFSDVRRPTETLEDRMDSFVLAETFKYLYLLFSVPNRTSFIDINDYVLTTEAHLLPLGQVPSSREHFSPAVGAKFSHQCQKVPTLDVDALKLQGRFTSFTSRLRLPVQQYISRAAGGARQTCKAERHRMSDDSTTPVVSQSQKRALRLSDFNPSDANHIALLNQMGIQVEWLDGDVMNFKHMPILSQMKSTELLLDGYMFMNEVREMSAAEATSTNMYNVEIHLANGQKIPAMQANFGPSLEYPIEGLVVIPNNTEACSELPQSPGSILLVRRGNCTFYEKVINSQNSGSSAVVVYDNSAGSNSIFTMVGLDDGIDEATIPSVFITRSHAERIANFTFLALTAVAS